MTTILGICNPNHDSGVALIEDGEILGAIDEGKISRLKRDARFPAAALNYVLELTEPEEIDYIALSGYDMPYPRREFRLKYDQTGSITEKADLVLRYLYGTIFQSNALDSAGKLDNYVQRGVVDLPDDIPVTYVDHHEAHAAGTYYTSGFYEATVLTADGVGDGFSSTVYAGEDGEITRVAWNTGVDSIGRLWSRIPTVYGFKGGRHAGKFMGLAAYAEEPPDELTNLFSKLLQIDGMSIQNEFFQSYERLSNEEQISKLKDLFGSYEAPLVAAALQKRTEEVLVEFCRSAIDEVGHSDIAIAGGVFANVKVNQRLYELEEVGKIYVHPEMRDSGLALGAALQVYANRYNLEPSFMTDVFHGPKFDTDDISDAVTRNDLADQYDVTKYSEQQELAAEVATRLAEGEVVNLYTGRVEYGPRALGNRSTLYQPTDPSAIKWLNERLNRTEFMPFAPVTLAEYATECYEELDIDRCPASRFMTISFDCTEKMAERSPGVVHVDGTARPQIIDEDTHPLYYSILLEYHDRTGIPSLINTSFNMHGEPIVCTPAQAIESFEQSNTDVLVLENTMIIERDS